MVLAGQPLDQHVEQWPRGAVAGIPADAESVPREVLEQPVGIGLTDVDFLDAAVALGPVAGGGALADLLDLGPRTPIGPLAAA